MTSGPPRTDGGRATSTAITVARVTEPTELTERVRQLLDGPRRCRWCWPATRSCASPLRRTISRCPHRVWAELIAAMRETMHAAPGVGLAAPQIGLGIRVAVHRGPGRCHAGTCRRTAALPDAAKGSGESPVRGRCWARTPRARIAEFYEGCLSVPGYQAVVARAGAVRLRCLDENGTGVDEVITGWAARIVAHETDHLDGILYLDRALTRSLATTANLIDHWSGQPMSTIRGALGF